MVATQGLRDSGWCQAVCGLNRHTAENVGAEMRRQLWWTWARCPASVCLSLFICRLGEAVRTSWHMGTCPARPTSVTGGQCVLCTHGSDHSGHATRGLNPGYRLQGTGWPSQRDGGRSQEKLRGGWLRPNLACMATLAQLCALPHTQALSLRGLSLPHDQ